MRLAPRLPLVLGCTLILSIILPATAHAQYLDPGSGSIIVQAVIAGAIGMAAVFRFYWRSIKGFVTRRSKSDAEL